MELAKQGDPQAIASLINRSLASKGIHAEAKLEAESLTISLHASQVPNQKAVVTIIHRGMVILQIEQIKHVKILTYRSDNNYLAWQNEFSLDNQTKEVLPTLQANEANNDSGQDQGVNLVSNPKGVILVQKFSQIQKNLQEYQDIIVRFTDEHVGTVRCLTTLTELIQVISKPSFLFAAVASNPNLRSLLDTIAESSKTDEQGDQVITNLSILQPGQQWQKAKIRLVSKIFLEPAEDQDDIKDRHQGITVDLQETTPQPVELDNPKPLSPPAVETEDLLTNSESLIGQASEISEPVASKSVTVDSLFDEFPEPSSSSLKLIDDVTEIPELTDSLFDDFIDAGDKKLFDDQNLHVDLAETAPTDGEDDLFDNFSFASQTTDLTSKEFNANNLESNIDAIKSIIPKQSLDQLLSLMEEEEQTKIELQTANNKLIDKDEKLGLVESDLGATTIEKILGNMETINLNGSSTKEESKSSDFVTLENFSEDLESLGF
ncbi:MAG: hypothetical protein DCF19_21065 [Pseudanabaena frigida]|uniref:Uncharacterized protein n=1 Tax=Pseudanabaena frigida TaxID=945775 RepID=A0A2W4VZM4_9CYAN|nr:MAG: hypothetical protein DCF19_21065 [Pseudanabaena frigida]